MLLLPVLETKLSLSLSLSCIIKIDSNLVEKCETSSSSKSNNFESKPLDILTLPTCSGELLTISLGFFSHQVQEEIKSH